MIETPTGKRFYTDYENGYKQGRTDAIEEFFKMLESVSFGNRKGLVHWKDIVSIREQLKEQK